MEGGDASDLRIAADFDQAGSVTERDIGFFLVAFESGDTRADFDGDCFCGQILIFAFNPSKPGAEMPRRQAYVVYSQVLKGAAYMNIAQELEVHAAEELSHALSLSKQIDYLGGMPVVMPMPVKTSERAMDTLRFDLENETETIRDYRERVRQCEALGEFAMAEQTREILVQEQEHQIDLATALGVDVPDMSDRSAGR